MAIIYSYPKANNLNKEDLLIISKRIQDNGVTTIRNYSIDIETMADFINSSGLLNLDLDNVLNNGNESQRNANVGIIGLYNDHEPSGIGYLKISGNKNRFDFFDVQDKFVASIDKNKIVLNDINTNKLFTIDKPSTINEHRTASLQDKSGTIAYLSDINELPAYINYFDFSSELTTNITSSNTWFKLDTSTTSLFSRNGLIHTKNRVTNTSSTKVFKVEGIVSLSAGNNNEIHVAFFKNNELYPCSEQSFVTSSGGKASAIPFHCVIELKQGDYIEVWVKNSNATNNIILKNVNVIVSEL